MGFFRLSNETSGDSTRLIIYQSVLIIGREWTDDVASDRYKALGQSR